MSRLQSPQRHYTVHPPLTGPHVVWIRTLNASAVDIGMPTEVALSDQCFFFLDDSDQSQGHSTYLVMRLFHMTGPLGFWKILMGVNKYRRSPAWKLHHQQNALGSN